MRIVLGLLRDIFAVLGDRIMFGELRELVRANEHRKGFRKLSLRQLFLQYAKTKGCSLPTVYKVWNLGNENLAEWEDYNARRRRHYEPERGRGPDPIFQAISREKFEPGTIEVDEETGVKKGEWQQVMKKPEDVIWFDKMLAGPLLKSAMFQFASYGAKAINWSDWELHMLHWFSRLTVTHSEALRRTVMRYWLKETLAYLNKKVKTGEIVVSADAPRRGGDNEAGEEKESSSTVMDSLSSGDKLSYHGNAARAETVLGTVKGNRCMVLTKPIVDAVVGTIADKLVEKGLIPEKKRDKMVKWIKQDFLEDFDFDAHLRTSAQNLTTMYFRHWDNPKVVRDNLNTFEQVERWL